MSIKIVDKLNLTESKRYKNQAGFLVLPDCTLARSGILEYSEVEDENGQMIADGQLITVYRPPEAIKECVEQFNNLPLTCHHPQSNEVNPDNALGVTVGALGQNPACKTGEDGEVYVTCDIIVYDADTIAAIEAGELEELSAGYETAFRAKNGVTKNGYPYQAEQYYLSPNHVALVPRGRCGSQCRICDNAADEDKTSNKEMKKMAGLKISKKPSRWLLAIGDSGEAVEITEEQAKALQAEDPTLEVEEITEDQVEKKEDELCPKCGKEIPENGTDEDEEKKLDAEAEEKKEDEDEEKKLNAEAEEKKEDEDEEKKGDEEIDKRTLIDEIGGILKDKLDEELWRMVIGKVEQLAYNGSENDPATDEDEDEGEGKAGGNSELVYEVEFEDGKTGKMDEEAYKHVDALMNNNGDNCKKGDAAESYASMLLLTSHATQILGDSFDAATYVKGNKVDTAEIKKACIRKVMPNVVVKNLKGDALEQVFRAAVATKKQNRDTWHTEVKGLAEAAQKNVVDGDNASPAEKARKAYLDRQHGLLK